MNFFTELKRRNVFKVGWIYLLISWVLLQLADITFPAFDAPPWTIKVTIFLVLLGFPFALLMAWAFELTPDGLRRESALSEETESATRSTATFIGRFKDIVLISALAIAVGYIIWQSGVTPNEISDQTAAITSAVQAEAQPTPAGQTGSPAESSGSGRITIAVLPFANRSNQPEDQFFTDGIHDDVVTGLAKISSLRVITRTSVNRYRGSDLNIAEIARELSAQHIIQGGIQRAGDLVRINVQLIDAASEVHLWAESFDRELNAENLFAVQNEIAAAIAGALQATLTPGEQARMNEVPTTDLEAYYAYLDGRHLMSRRTADSLFLSHEKFQQAVELDPDFALAWVGIAETSSLLVTYGSLSQTEGDARVHAAATRALEINPDLGEAHAALGRYHEHFGEMTKAEASFRRAIELSPSYANAHNWYSAFLSRFPDRLEESLKLIITAAQLDPLSPAIQVAIGNRLVSLGRFDAAEKHFRHVNLTFPEFAGGWFALAQLQAGAWGQFDQAIRTLQKARSLDPGNIRQLESIAHAWINLEDGDSASSVIDEIRGIEPQHWSIRRLETTIAFVEQGRNLKLPDGFAFGHGLLEYPSFLFLLGTAHVAQGNVSAGLDMMTKAYPGFLDQQKWASLITEFKADACIVAWGLKLSNQSSEGSDLARQTIEFLTQTLPGYIEHADRYSASVCYLTLDQPTAAMDALSLQITHGHINDWWWYTRLPLFDALAGEQRFQLQMARIRDKLADQRASLQQDAPG
jgi:TolB-like protein